MPPKQPKTASNTSKQAAVKKTSRKRKSRTADFSSSSESSSDSDSDSSSSSSLETASDGSEKQVKVKPREAKEDGDDNLAQKKEKKSQKSSKQSSTLNTTTRQETIEATSSKTAATAAKQEADFDTWYLRTITAQYGNELEKLRQAPDFKDSSVAVLVDALKQGAAVFSDDEKRAILARSTPIKAKKLDG